MSTQILSIPFITVSLIPEDCISNDIIICFITAHIPYENHIIDISIINTFNGIKSKKKKKDMDIMDVMAKNIVRFLFLKVRDIAHHTRYASAIHKLIYHAIFSKLTH